MTSSAPAPKHHARAARRSLADLAASAPAPVQVPVATGAVIETPPPPAPVVAPASAAASPNTRAKYPSVTVYLPPRAIRLVKELSLEENRRITDILAEAVDEYLVKRGHPSLEQLSK
jgi:hypothetical protein